MDELRRVFTISRREIHRYTRTARSAARRLRREGVRGVGGVRGVRRVGLRRVHEVGLLRRRRRGRRGVGARGERVAHERVVEVERVHEVGAELREARVAAVGALERRVHERAHGVRARLQPRQRRVGLGRRRRLGVRLVQQRQRRVHRGLVDRRLLLHLRTGTPSSARSRPRGGTFIREAEPLSRRLI